MFGQAGAPARSHPSPRLILPGRRQALAQAHLETLQEPGATPGRRAAPRPFPPSAAAAGYGAGSASLALRPARQTSAGRSPGFGRATDAPIVDQHWAPTRGDIGQCAARATVLPRGTATTVRTRHRQLTGVGRDADHSACHLYSFHSHRMEMRRHDPFEIVTLADSAEPRDGASPAHGDAPCLHENLPGSRSGVHRQPDQLPEGSVTAAACAQFPAGPGLSWPGTLTFVQLVGH